MKTCGVIMPMFNRTPCHGEILECLRHDRHDLTDGKHTKHLVLRSDEVYIVWYRDDEDQYEDKDDEDFIYYEISAVEAQKMLLKGVTK
ncbi:hypothetical protein KW800_00285 [Candidatus Parcubacteria bacterium]|nr:hypothetical protein [Candidatus Parcubacteria bacterium]